METTEKGFETGFETRSIYTIYTSHPYTQHQAASDIPMNNYTPHVTMRGIVTERHTDARHPISRTQNDGPTETMYIKQANRMPVINGEYPGRRRCEAINADPMLQVLRSQASRSRGWRALCCICRNGIPQEHLAGSASWINVILMYQRKLKVGSVVIDSVTLSWWLISSSIVRTILSSRLSPGLSSTPPCCLLRDFDVFPPSFPTSIPTRW